MRRLHPGCLDSDPSDQSVVPMSSFDRRQTRKKKKKKKKNEDEDEGNSKEDDDDVEGDDGYSE
jgi:hypothetical protein